MKTEHNIGAYIFMFLVITFLSILLVGGVDGFLAGLGHISCKVRHTTKQPPNYYILSNGHGYKYKNETRISLKVHKYRFKAVTAAWKDYEDNIKTQKQNEKVQKITKAEWVVSE